MKAVIGVKSLMYWKVLSVLLMLGCVGSAALMYAVDSEPPVPHGTAVQSKQELIPSKKLELSQAGALSVQLSSASVKQGEVLRVEVPAACAKTRLSSVSFAGRKAEFFSRQDGSQLALLPVSVFQKPDSYPLVVYGENQQVVKQLSVPVRDGAYKTQNVNVSQSTAGLQPLPGEMEAIQGLKDEVSAVQYWREPFQSPTPDCQNSPFGVKRMHNGVPTGDYHKGVDLRSPQGRPIRAITGGKVKIARMYRLHGGTVGLDHGQGVSSIYIHMSRLNVKPGDSVKSGDVIGYVGSTGFATGPHLHWGLYVSGLPVNPNQWIAGVPLCR